jgi:hypothetical protein
MVDRLFVRRHGIYSRDGLATLFLLGRGGALVLVIVALWIGSVVAGWFLFWPWLVVPVAVIGVYAMRVTAGFRAARVRNGIPVGGTGRPGTSMVPANTRLLIVTFLQHLVIFGITAAVRWTLG